jgi:hypothetical protein
MSKKIMEVVDVRVSLLKSNPPSVSIDVLGKVSSTGWTNARLEPRFYAGGSPADGIQDFDCVADAPDGMVLWVITPIKASLLLQGFPDSIKGVRIHSEVNSLESRFDDPDVRTFAL